MSVIDSIGNLTVTVVHSFENVVDCIMKLHLIETTVDSIIKLSSSVAVWPAMVHAPASVR